MMKSFFLKIIRFYQKNISPMSGPNCRYSPTCSKYTYMAIEEHGAFIGILLGIWRILRCNPFSKGGYDPVPLKKQKRK